MVTPDKNKKQRGTEGSRKVAEYKAKNDLKAVAISIPEKLHSALLAMAQDGKEHGTKDGGTPVRSIQVLINVACSAFYYDEGCTTNPPLAAFEPSVLGRDPRFTWYANKEIYRITRIIAAKRSSSLRQLVISAVVEFYKDEPAIRDLNTEVDGVARMRVPSVTD